MDVGDFCRHQLPAGLLPQSLFSDSWRIITVQIILRLDARETCIHHFWLYAILVWKSLMRCIWLVGFTRVICGSPYRLVSNGERPWLSMVGDGLLILECDQFSRQQLGRILACLYHFHLKLPSAHQPSFTATFCSGFNDFIPVLVLGPTTNLLDDRGAIIAMRTIMIVS